MPLWCPLASSPAQPLFAAAAAAKQCCFSSPPCRCCCLHIHVLLFFLFVAVAAICETNGTWHTSLHKPTYFTSLPCNSGSRQAVVDWRVGCLPQTRHGGSSRHTTAHFEPVRPSDDAALLCGLHTWCTACWYLEQVMQAAVCLRLILCCPVQLPHCVRYTCYQTKKHWTSPAHNVTATD